MNKLLAAATLLALGSTGALAQQGVPLGPTPSMALLAQPNTWLGTQTFNGIVTIENSLATFNPASSVGSLTGNAPIVFQPAFATAELTVGQMIIPVIPTAAANILTDNAAYLTAYNCKQGNSGSYIQAGVPGSFSCYEANIYTAQGSGDIVTNNTGHAFGASIINNGGAFYDFFDAVITIGGGNPADSNGLNLTIAKNVADSGGTRQYMVNLNSGGSQAVNEAIIMTGPYVNGIYTLGATFSGDFINATGFTVDGSGNSTVHSLTTATISAPSGQFSINNNSTATNPTVFEWPNAAGTQQEIRIGRSSTVATNSFVAIYKGDATNTVQDMFNFDSNTFLNEQAGCVGIGAASCSAELSVTGSISATTTISSTTGFIANSSTGLTQTCTANQAKTLIFTLGILTGGTCNS